MNNLTCRFNVRVIRKGVTLAQIRNVSHSHVIIAVNHLSAMRACGAYPGSYIRARKITAPDLFASNRAA